MTLKPKKGYCTLYDSVHVRYLNLEPILVTKIKMQRNHSYTSLWYVLNQLYNLLEIYRIYFVLVIKQK